MKTLITIEIEHGVVDSENVQAIAKESKELEQFVRVWIGAQAWDHVRSDFETVKDVNVIATRSDLLPEFQAEMGIDNPFV